MAPRQRESSADENAKASKRPRREYEILFARITELLRQGGDEGWPFLLWAFFIDRMLTFTPSLLCRAARGSISRIKVHNFMVSSSKRSLKVVLDYASSISRLTDNLEGVQSAILVKCKVSVSIAHL